MSATPPPLPGAGPLASAVAPAAPPGFDPWSSSATTGWLVALLGWTALIAFYDLGGGAAFDPPDVWVAQTAREMRESTDWLGYIVPHFSGETRMQKSPGPYWLVCAVSALRGTPVDEVSARVPNAAAAVLLVATVFWLTRRIAGGRAATFAGFALASSTMFLYWSHRAASDLGLTALTTLSLAALWIGSELEPPGRRRIALWMLGYFAAGLAMLYKMPMPLVCVGLPAALYVLLLRRWTILASAWHVAGLLLFALPWLPWAAAVLWIEPVAWDKWFVEYVDRFTGALPNVEEQRSDWKLYFLYIGVALAFTIPYSLSLPAAIVRAFRGAEVVEPRGAWFLLIWFFSLLAFFTAASGKETRYFLPALPPLFVLLGVELSRFFDARDATNRAASRAAFRVVLVLAPLAAAVAGVYLHRFCRQMEPYGVYAWSEVGRGFVVAAAIVVAGVVASAWLYARQRGAASFGALVATMWTAFLWAWPNLMPAVASQAPFRDFAAQLRALAPEHRARLRQIAHQDPRVIWYGDVRFPRVIDQLKLLEMQGGRRDRERERRLVGEEMVRRIESDELALFVANPEDYVSFHVAAPRELAEQGRTLPPTYVWLTARVGHPKHRMLVFGNRPPPWPEPELALPEKVREKIRAGLAAGAERVKAASGAGG